MGGLLALVVLSIVVQATGKKEVVDLSHQQKTGLVAYPIYPTLNFTVVSRGIHPKLGLWLEFNRFETIEHYGTHVDAPCHLMQGKWRIHQIPLSQFMGPAVVIDLTERAAANPDAQLTVADLQAWEERNGEIPDQAIVLMKTGWDKKFSDDIAFLGTNTPKDSDTFHFPGFHPDATKWLVENRPNFHGIGVDTISLDFGATRSHQAHVNLFSANKIGYENLANLEKIPEVGAMFYAVPINLFDGSGCPVRAFAVLDSNASARLSSLPYMYLAMLIIGIQAFMLHFM